MKKMKIYYSPINLNLYNIFEKLTEPGIERHFLATKSMKPGDLILFHIGNQNKKFESGVYAYGIVLEEPYIYLDNPNDFCYEKNCVNVGIIDLNKEKPIIPTEEITEFIKPSIRRHLIKEEYYNTILKMLGFNNE